MATWKQITTLKGYSSDITSVVFSPDGNTLAFTSKDHTVYVWSYKEINPKRNISSLEQKIGLKLEGLDLVPYYGDVDQKNLFTISSVHRPSWPETHPFHCLQSAERGDDEAMLQLGIINERDDDYERAVFWYTKATDAGSDTGKERLELLNKRLGKDQ